VVALHSTNGGAWKNGDVTRATLAVIAMMAALSSLGCADDGSGGDCIMQGLARMGREHAPSLSVTCEMPADSWMVAFPADVEPQKLPGLPRDFWPVITESAKAGHNWCVITPRETATPTPGADGDPATRTLGTTVCGRLRLDVEDAMAVPGRRFVAELRLKPDGKGVLRSLSVPTR
jgi:hypothetical protein